MTTTIRCDLCNTMLESNEITTKKSMLGKATLASKYSVKTEFEGSVRQGELCFKCALNLRNFIDSEKLKCKK